MEQLINKYLPHYIYNEYHEALVNAPVADCFLAARNLDMGRSVITKILMKIRGLPTRDLTLQGFIKNNGFTYLEEDSNTEFVIDASRHNLEIVWNFYFKKTGKNKTLISTETRVWCLTKRAKSLFSLYWFFVKPFSGLIRLEMLRLISKKVEEKV